MRSTSRVLTLLLALLVAAATITTIQLGSVTPAAADGEHAVPGISSGRSGLLGVGGYHTCAIVERDVRCWGDNQLGQLGLGDTETRGDQPDEMGTALPPVDVGGRAVSLAGGLGHTCAIRIDATVVCWGSNSSGQLGTGDLLARGDEPGEMGASIPAVPLGRPATAITAGAEFSCAILDDGSVVCWGDNSLGQLGVGDTEDRGDQPGEALVAVDLGPGRTALSVSAGAGHVCALTDLHDVVCWGSAQYGQLASGTTGFIGDEPGEMGASLVRVPLVGAEDEEAHAVAISVGQFHSCAVLEDEPSIACWGRNDRGQLALAPGESVGDDAGETPSLLAMAANVEIVGIAGFGDSTCASTNLGPICWGANESGQLGEGNADDRSAAGFASALSANAVLAGGELHLCELNAAGVLRCVGDNQFGQLGLGDTDDRGDQPGEVAAMPMPDLSIVAAATSISVASRSGCAILVDATVKCWGQNAVGQLGLGDTVDRGDDAGEMGEALPTVDLGTNRTASAVDVSELRTACAIVDDGTVRCWGAASFGSSTGLLGDGTTEPRGDEPGETGDALPVLSFGSGRTATALSVGGMHGCVLLDDGSVKCWGDNSFGQLGLGDTAARGDQPGELGDALPVVDLGTGRTATAIATGTGNSCAILDTGDVKCWGYGGQGVVASATNIGNQPNEMGDALPVVPLGTGRTAVTISGGGSNMCALLDDGNVKCWGKNEYGSAGQGHLDVIGDDPAELGDALPPVDLGTGRTAVAIDASRTHVCALLDNGDLRCWGQNTSGELGIEASDNRGDGPAEMGDTLPIVKIGSTAVAVAVGSTHTCALRDDASVACWGYDFSGELGHDGATATSRGMTVGSMTSLPVTRLGGTAGTIAPAAGTPGFAPAPTSTAGANEAMLTWVAPADGGSPITGYRVEQSTDGVHWTVAVADTGTAATSRTIGGLTAGQAIRFRVAAINAVGRGPVSLSSAEAVPTAPPTTTAPTTTTPPTTTPPTTTPPKVNAVGFVPVVPARLADTRPTGETIDGQTQATGTIAAGTTLTVQITGRGNIPTGAHTASLNVTAVRPLTDGFITVHPCDRPRPNASNLNFTAGQNIPNAVTTKLAANGTVCIYTSATTHVIVDANGAHTS